MQNNLNPVIIEPIKRRRQTWNFITPDPAVFCPANGFPVSAVADRILSSLTTNTIQGLLNSINVSLVSVVT